LHQLFFANFPSLWPFKATARFLLFFLFLGLQLPRPSRRVGQQSWWVGLARRVVRDQLPMLSQIPLFRCPLPTLQLLPQP
jgi:hypothetical protein